MFFTLTPPSISRCNPYIHMAFIAHTAPVPCWNSFVRPCNAQRTLFFNPTPPPSPAGTPVIMRPRPGTCVSRQPVLGGGCVDLFPASSKSLNHYFLLETPTPTPTSTACGEILISAPNPNSDRLGNVWEISEKIGWNAPNPDPNRLTPTAWEISY